MEGEWILVHGRKKNKKERDRVRVKENKHIASIRCGFCGFHDENTVICQRYLMTDAEWLSFARYYSDIMEGKDEWLKNKVREWYFPLV